MIPGNDGDQFSEARRHALDQDAIEFPMALIGRLFAILFGFLAACFVAGMIVVIALLYPEFTDLGIEPPDPDTLNIVLGFGFIFVSGFALVPAMILVLDHRSLLYPQHTGLRGRRRDLRRRLLPRPDPVRSGDHAFRRHRAPPSRNHDRRRGRRRLHLLADRRAQCRRVA